MTKPISQFARIIKATEKIDGIKFFSDENSSLQVGVMVRPKGYVVEKHFHTNEIQEVLIVVYGKIRIEVEDNPMILNGGDAIHLKGGTHGLKFLEDSKIFEVKEGPYEPNSKVFGERLDN